MEKYYFTFGTDEVFPFGPDEFVVAEAGSRKDAVGMFVDRYPGQCEGVVNCAFIYTEAEFEKIRDRYYRGVKPSEVLRAGGV